MLLFVVCSCLIAVRRWWFAVGCLWFAGCCLCVVYQLCVVRWCAFWLLCFVCCLWFGIVCCVLVLMIATCLLLRVHATRCLLFVIMSGLCARCCLLVAGFVVAVCLLHVLVCCLLSVVC